MPPKFGIFYRRELTITSTNNFLDMKKITFILTSMLFLLVGGVKADPTSLLILGGTNWRAVSLYDTSLETNQREYGSWSSYENSKGESFYQTAIVKFEGGNDWQYCNLGQGQWKAAFTSGEQHRFVITFTTAVYNSTSYTGPSMDLQLVAIKNNSIIQTADIKEGASSGEITITEDYDEVVLIKTKEFGNDAFIPIASVTREISTASSVAAPTISPATDSTYDGDLSVTIIPGDGNDKVTYSVEGSNEDALHTSVDINSETVINLTGTNTITVTAIGYKGEDVSSAVVNTYTFEVPNGKETITSSNLPHEFNSWHESNSITIGNSNFSNIEEGDYVVFDVENVAQDGTVLGFRKGWDETPYRACTTTSSGNGAIGVLKIGDTQWWMKVNRDVVSALKYNEVRMQGGMVPDGLPNDPNDDIKSSVTLNSLNVYECKALNEGLDNSISSKINHVVVELTRSFVAGTWNTVCLPFALTSAQATQLFGEGYHLTKFTSVSGTTMQFATAANFEAGVPYLVKPTIDVSDANPVVLVDVNITAKNPQPVTHKGYNEEDYSFVGNFTQKKFTGDECNTSRFVATGDQLKKPTNNSTLKSLRCYFTVPAAAAARSLSFDIDEEGGTTSINTVQGSGVLVNGYYNLAGQRVAQPTKGLYIVNGKKVVIK